jgi:hypothetical protein
LAQPYKAKAQRPGRIVCDSTWHHYVNVNLDGTGSGGRTGLGTGSGAGFVPSDALEKIYAYYRNIASWLQPANRIWCSIFWDLVAVRFNPAIYEELLDIDRLVTWRDLVGVGREARNLIHRVRGCAAISDDVIGLLGADERTLAAADLLNSDELAGSQLDSEELVDGIYGGLLLEVARLLPVDADNKAVQRALEDGPGNHLKVLQECVLNAIRMGTQHQMKRLEKGLGIAKQLNCLR